MTPTQLAEIISATPDLTDIHFELDRPIKLRVRGQWTKQIAAEEGRRVTSNDLDRIAADVFGSNWVAAAEATGASTQCFNIWGKANLRVTLARTDAGKNHSIAIHCHPSTPFPLSQLAPAFITSALDHARGLLLITGRTGMGKTTMLASITEHLNKTRPIHIIAIGTPLEFSFIGEQAIVTHRHVPRDASSTAAAVHQAMLQRPDVIVVDSIADRETVDACLLAVEVGHLVVASIPSSTTIGAIQRITSFFPPDELALRCRMLAETLIGVVSLNLLPTTKETGYVIASEILANHKKQALALIEDPARQSQLRDFMKRSDDRTTRTMNAHLVELVREGAVSEQDAMRSSVDGPDLAQRLSATSAKPR